jgi:hypothetical protein
VGRQGYGDDAPRLRSGDARPTVAPTSSSIPAASPPAPAPAPARRGALPSLPPRHASHPLLLLQVRIQIRNPARARAVSARTSAACPVVSSRVSLCDPRPRRPRLV